MASQRAFRFGIVTGGADSRDKWVELARKTEQLGYATLLIVDRIRTPVAPLVGLTVAAEATTNLRVGTYVLANDFRHPALLAREIACLDVMSQGRVELGLGAGVGPSDYKELGIPFDAPGNRVSRLEESLQVIRGLWSGESFSFSGKYYTITDFRGMPIPLQQPHPPILIGSGGDRMLKISARLADIIVPTARFGASGVDREDTTAEAMDRKIALICEAAGNRSDQIELGQNAYTLTITDSDAEEKPTPGEWPMQKIPMTKSEAVDHLERLRERNGFSYFQLMESQLENFAPVVAKLAGK